jgi:hypothetical protein
MWKKIFFIFASILFYGCKEVERKAGSIFESLSSSYTGIDFNNLIPDTTQYSVISYEYTYNGSGVAIGDINNDGLEDIFFGANTESSKLYLNLGNLKFKDITFKANITTDVWVTGVSMVDINHDGWLDIYVCVAGNEPGQSRANLLFINNKDFTFTESASEYGLADTGFSTQAAFFDFNRDGYLDCYLMNHSNADRDASYLLPINKTGTAKSTDKLLKNLGNGQFEDVSSQAGITVEGYGLGLIIQDFNNDGWPDIFVANDYIYNDLLYINNHDGTFTEKAQSYFPYNSQFAMGVDVGDINNDGYFDLMELDMLPPDNKRRKLLAGSPNYKRFEMASQLGYTHQFMRNTLYLGNANNYFTEIGIYAGVEATDWSWSVLIQDFDNDGLEDIHITNGYLKNITDLDFASYSNLQKGGRIKEGQSMDNIKEAIKNLDGAKLSNYIFQNKGNLTFEDQTEEWGLKIPSFSNGAAYSDLDNDGDLELVVSNINDEAFVYKNLINNHNSISIELKGYNTNPFAEGAKVVVNTYLGRQYLRTKTSARGYLSSVSQKLHFGLGANDSVKSIHVLWPNGEAKFYESTDHTKSIVIRHAAGELMNESELLKYSAIHYSLKEVQIDSGIQFFSPNLLSNDFDYQPMLPKYYSKTGPYFALADINKDGLQDIYFGGSNQRAGIITKQNQMGYFETHQSLEMGYQDREAAFIDLNDDDHLDLLVLTGGYNLPLSDYKLSTRLYLNNGEGYFERDFDILPTTQGNHSCLALADFNKNGKPDIFIGGHVYPMKFPLPSKSALLVYENNEYKNIASEIEGLERIGIVNDATWIDIDTDGWEDLIIVGEFMEPTFYKNQKGKLERIKVDFGKASLSGHWNVVKAHDFDQDGNMDFFLGNMGSNSIFSGTNEAPVKVFASDYDGNGSIDPIITYSINTRDYPFASRDMHMQQLPYLKKKFTNYEAFSEAALTDLFTKDEIAKSYQVQINFSESIILKNLSNFKFEIIRLPPAINLNWINDAIIEDVNNDGLADIIVVGNQNSMEVSYGNVIGDFFMILEAKSPFEFKNSLIEMEDLQKFASTSQIHQLKLAKDTVFSVGFLQDTLRFYRIVKMPK